ncbi:GNAT family N-acetyltransferase [Cumulibacter soli]|uniref:GNAT family N-acetyltransferase n=1 Tax=Cumulibacter soli TaxID=2546344 RepID=UPI0010673B84|nr:GNAT family N-acetyltransferase [Cumulibacter soli]
MSKDLSTVEHARLRDNTDSSRFELHHAGLRLGVLHYTRLKPNRYALQHTEVYPEYQGRGVGGTMIRRVLDEIQRRNGTITPICPFVVDFLERTPDYNDIRDARHPGYRDRAAAEAARSRAD